MAIKYKVEVEVLDANGNTIDCINVTMQNSYDPSMMDEIADEMLTSLNDFDVNIPNLPADAMSFQINEIKRTSTGDVWVVYDDMTTKKM